MPATLCRRACCLRIRHRPAGQPGDARDRQPRLAGVAVLTATTGVIGVPGTEPMMLFAGFDVYNGNLTLPGIIVAGVVGDMAGASIAYAIGYLRAARAARAPGEQAPRQPAALERAHRWFERQGRPAIFVSRMLPLVRAVVPVCGRRRRDAVRALLPGRARLDHLDQRARRAGTRGGQRLEQLAPPPRVRRLRGRRAVVVGDRLPDHAPARALAHAGPSAGTDVCQQSAADAGGSAEDPSRRRAPAARRQALALGALHGPAELLPISSSGHIALVPWLLRLGLRPSSTPSCASRSRSRCTPAPPRRC